MKGLDAIRGQKRAVALLIRMLERDRVPHALLFSGIDGIGKQTTAKALALTSNCRARDGTSACMACRSCRQVASGNHPDIITIESEGRYIKLDQMRELRKRLCFAPVNGARRFIIINDAHLMNVEAANAILKVLEEPPMGTHIVMTCHQVSDLVPTIVSRTQHVPFNPLPRDTIIRELIDSRGLDRSTATAVAALAKGSIGKALSCSPEKWIDWRNTCLRQIASLPGKSMHEILVAAETLSKGKDKVQEVLDLFQIWFRDLLMYKFRKADLINRDWLEEIATQSGRFSVEELLDAISAAYAAQRAILRNLNPRLALEVLLVRHTWSPSRMSATSVSGDRKDPSGGR